MGEGTFAKVVECWDRKERKYVAVKIVRAIEKYVEAAEIEVDILKDVNKQSANKDRYDLILFPNI
jgi:dual-specificity kinase